MKWETEQTIPTLYFFVTSVTKNAGSQGPIMIMYQLWCGVHDGYPATDPRVWQIRYAWGLGCHLRASPLLQVVERHTLEEVGSQGGFQPHVIVVDAAQITPEQFGKLIAACALPSPVILSIDPITYQLTVLSSPKPLSPLAEAARVIEVLSFTLSQPA